MGASAVPISGPVRHDPDAMRLIVPGREPIAIRNAAGPVRAFEPGWHAVGLFTLLDPL